MNYTIGTDSVGLSEISGNLRKSSANLDSIFNEVKGSINKVNDNLEGALADSYMASFQIFQKNFTEFKDLIDRMAQAIDETVAKQKETDSKIASTIE